MHACIYSVAAMCLRFVRRDSHDVIGIVKAIWGRMLIFGKRAASQSLIATAGKAGLNCGSIAKYRLLHRVSSISNNSGDHAV